MTCHIMTAEESENPLEGFPIDSNAEFLRRSAYFDTQGIRPTSFVRLIYIHHLIQAEYEDRGPVFAEWLEEKPDHVTVQLANFIRGITVEDYHRIAELGEDYFNIEGDFLEISDRTAEDYLKTIRAFEKVL